LVSFYHFRVEYVLEPCSNPSCFFLDQVIFFDLSSTLHFDTEMVSK
jgi:hypothetical protein